MKWATCNIGASVPKEFGDYFAWGETKKYSESGYTSQWKDKTPSTLITEGAINASYTLTSEYDAASANWKGSWRMPTNSEITELINNCTWEWTTLDGVEGYKIISNISGYETNFIFLPSAGYYKSSTITGTGLRYWCSTLNSAETNNTEAFDLEGNSSSKNVLNGIRIYGCSIRPVAP